MAFMAARHEEGCYEDIPSHIFLFANNYRTMTSGGQGDTPYFIQEIRPGAGFNTGDFVEEKLEGLP